ncbi:MAG: homoserine O-acetyltransferase [Candidatus Dadabacteria bacterium]|nr:homoserine O-acetyltransferase [Candidatus Dadabacteria bacterium]NIS07941.1 homoserine O-acetyltransferase [Candidatus Dadabacteria bacterium]NIY21525.1 homoserine O-acetyltransferase [Candidatus Dadabacteria bacterium]
MTTEELGESPVAIVDKGSVGIVEPKSFTFGYPPCELELENDSKLGPVTVAYETYGSLNKNRDNVILIEHALTANAHAAGKHSPGDTTPGWWDSMIGPGKAFDSNKYYIICSNVLGSCYGTTGPASPNPKTNKPYGYEFPIITITDMVKVQKKLLDHLGIESIACIAGGSMGGMQAMEWALQYPDIVKSIILIASGAWSNPQAIAIHKVGIQAIKDDPNFSGGDYYDKESPDKGLAIARMIGHITYLNDKMLWEKFGRRSDDISDMKSSFKYRFEVEKYLQYQGKKFVSRFDANSYIYIMRAIDMYDASEGYDSLDESFGRLKIDRALVISFTSDWLSPSYQSKEIVSALKANNIDTAYKEIKSQYGHDSFLLKYKQLTPPIKRHLKKL